MKAQRTYRYLHNQEKLKYFTVQHFETDLNIGVDYNSYNVEMKDFVLKRIVAFRNEILHYNQFINPEFLLSFHPIGQDKQASELIKIMINASSKARTGPMAAVAGAFAEMVAKELKRNYSINEIIVENGGDIFVQSNSEKILALYAGKSVFSNKLGIKIPNSNDGLGIATSSGTVGHSFSTGKADALTVVCKSAAVADAYATALANKVKCSSDIEDVINEVKSMREILSIIIIKNNAIGCYGDFEVLSLQKQAKRV